MPYPSVRAAPVILIDGTGANLGTETNPVRVVLVEGTNGGLAVDPITGALATIAVEHFEAHHDEMFEAAHRFNDVANGNAADFLVITGTLHLHALIYVVASGKARVDWYEGTVANPNGTGVTVFNIKRASTEVATFTCFHTPIVAGGSEGTALPPGLVPGASNRRGGGVSRSEGEYILRTGTKHLIRVTNDSGAAADILIGVRGYEEDSN